MLFKFKSKAVTVRAFCPISHSHAYNLAAIELAAAHIPEWFAHSQPSRFDWSSMSVRPSIRSCAGLTHYLNRGLLIRSWTDIAVSLDLDSIRTQASDGVTRIDYVESGVRNHLRANQHNLKIISPWRLVCDQPLHFLALDAYWHRQDHDPYVSVPGDLEFVSNSATNINLMVHGDPCDFVIDFLRPLYHLVPVSEHKIRIVNELVTDQEYQLLINRTRPVCFLHRYNRLRRLLNK